MEKNVAREVEEVYEELTQTGAQFWLMSGSALGAALAGKMLPGDRDVDIGMHQDDRYKLSAALEKLSIAGFEIKERYDPVNQEVKGMITIKRRIPFDIKFYREEKDYCWRALHKSHGFLSSLVWQMIDCAYFKKIPKVKLEKRFWRSALSLLLLASLAILCRGDKWGGMRERMVCQLSELWKKLKVEYGYECLPSHYFKNFRTVYFYNRPFNVFEEVDSYLDQEYGGRWRENKKKYSSGGWAKPSHRVTSPLIFTGHR